MLEAVNALEREARNLSRKREKDQMYLINEHACN
jgi:hypothetical protein